jgi:hypothetical protein
MTLADIIKATKTACLKTKEERGIFMPRSVKILSILFSR